MNLVICLIHYSSYFQWLDFIALLCERKMNLSVYSIRLEDRCSNNKVYLYLGDRVWNHCWITGCPGWSFLCFFSVVLSEFHVGTWQSLLSCLWKECMFYQDYFHVRGSVLRKGFYHTLLCCVPPAVQGQEPHSDRMCCFALCSHKLLWCITSPLPHLLRPVTNITKWSCCHFQRSFFLIFRLMF